MPEEMQEIYLSRKMRVVVEGEEWQCGRKEHPNMILEAARGERCIDFLEISHKQTTTS